MRSCEDIDESVLSYAEVKALAAGNPEIREKMTLDVEVAKLKMAKSSHRNNIYSLQDKLNKHYPTSIKLVESSIERLQQDETLAAKTKGEEFPGMEIMGKRYSKRDTAAEALHKLCKGIASFIPTDLGEYRGFEMSVRLSDIYKMPEVTLKGTFSHSVSLGDSPSGNITRLNNALDKIPERIEAQKERIESLRKQVKDAREEVLRPFQKEDELNIKLSRLQELDISLNMDGKIRSEEQPEAVAAKSVPDERNYLIDSAKRKLGGNSFVMDAQKCRVYSGDVLEIGEKYAVQKISHSQGIIHNLNNNPELLEMIRTHGKDNICVTYDNIGKCSVAQKGNGQEQEAVSY
ncbi:hypothetical protein FACS1894216_20980 [Synergistales bacterium]|nr:hypothetical protein FACS1894216_20980 [Synergistales bacterium]